MRRPYRLEVTHHCTFTSGDEMQAARVAGHVMAMQENAAVKAVSSDVALAVTHRDYKLRLRTPEGEKLVASTATVRSFNRIVQLAEWAVYSFLIAGGIAHELTFPVFVGLFLLIVRTQDARPR